MNNDTEKELGKLGDDLLWDIGIAKDHYRHDSIMRRIMKDVFELTKEGACCISYHFDSTNDDINYIKMFYEVCELMSNKFQIESSGIKVDTSYFRTEDPLLKTVYAQLGVKITWVNV